MEGDVILLDSSTKFNSFGQKLLTLDFLSSPPTHVAFVSGKYSVHHAMPRPAHIEVTLVHEILNPKKRWSVWRNTHLNNELVSDQGAFGRLSVVVNNFLGDAYRFQNFFSKKPDSSYCSELVGKIMSGLGKELPMPSSKLLPLHLQKYFIENDEWIDVTVEYVDLLKEDYLYVGLYADDVEVQALCTQAFIAAKLDYNNFSRAFEVAASGAKVKSKSRVRVDGDKGWVSIVPIGPTLPRTDERMRTLAGKYSELFMPVPTALHDRMLSKYEAIKRGVIEPD
ncbi:hypothetical protein E8E95_19345 [Pseudomonas sp. BN414]|uniref:hypothetical protein n=1 Tax=Pseudomonas sp. BN414 TaxID=2567888 RepID=UPI002454C8FD|nr:hypothetical protein [Pseudomonas sp. BN414]MDH4568846.1 hypothetical protein [Pseudomonas sp. BN414]